VSEFHPQSIISPRTNIGSSVRIGAYAVVGDEVELGDGCVLDHHAVVQGPARLGKNNRVYPFAVVGGDPQDLTFAGQRVAVEIGDDNTFREFCTVNRGTVKGGGTTRLGSHNLIMSYAHIGHDSQIGSHTIFVNGATIGAYSPVQQFCRIGRHAYIGAYTVITQDVLPFAKIVAPRETKCYGVNTIGLERSGFTPERLDSLEKAFRFLLRSNLNTSQALEKMRETLSGSQDVQYLIEFIESAKNGIIK
jgi:UDP-N-acetylglucosamine acyltransferase